MVDITIVNGGYFMVYKPTFTSLGPQVHTLHDLGILKILWASFTSGFGQNFPKTSGKKSEMSGDVWK
jgi:hypothetical protein